LQAVTTTITMARVTGMTTTNTASIARQASTRRATAEYSANKKPAIAGFLLR